MELPEDATSTIHPVGAWERTPRQPIASEGRRMPEAHHVTLDRARRAAKKLTRTDNITHQQALDHIAVEAGYRHWSDMLGGERSTSMDVTATPNSTATRSPTLASVEAETLRLMADPRRRTGMRMSDWIATVMRTATGAALDRTADMPFGHALRETPVDVRTVAQAVDPSSGPWDGSETSIVVRCPVHDDRSPSLLISGKGRNLRVVCQAGCPANQVQDKVFERITDAAFRAVAFMKANDRSRVVEASSAGKPGIGGLGGRYRFADRTVMEMDVLPLRMLPDGYPVWYDGPTTRTVDALERALRVMNAGRHPINIERPQSDGDGLWRLHVDGGHGYRLLVSTNGRPGRFGVNAGFTPELSVPDAETYPSARKAVDRIHALLRRAETVDPAERLANQKRYDREQVHKERVSGTDDDGWGWWAGPNEEEFTWGGPWKVRSEAISQGNGQCEEKGDVFYVIQAQTSPDGPDADGMHEFEQQRGLKRCRAT